MAEPALEAMEPADLRDPVILSSGRDELVEQKTEKWGLNQSKTCKNVGRDFFQMDGLNYFVMCALLARICGKIN